MSNFLAVATVTAAISHLLEGVRADVPGTKITTRPPDVANSEAPPANKLNVFLYQVAPNLAYRNQDLPSRDSQGVPVKTTRLALNLHYLLTAYASDNDELIAQQILASAMRVLDENSVISRDIVRDAVAARQSLKMSDLADQVESVKLTLQPMNIEELSKLWSSFFQTNYRTSVAYQATTVLIDSKLLAKPSLPVKKRLLYTMPFRRPVIERIEPQVVEGKAGAKIVITGTNLNAERITVDFDRAFTVPLDHEEVTDTKISVEVPAGLGAGVRQVRVIHPLMMGSPAKEHVGFESNTAAFVLSPLIKSISPSEVKLGKDLTLAFAPPATARQKIEVLIGNVAIPLPARTEGSAPKGSITLKVPEDLAVGKFLIRLRIDGAETLLESDKDTENPVYVGPIIEVKA